MRNDSSAGQAQMRHKIRKTNHVVFQCFCGTLAGKKAILMLDIDYFTASTSLEEESSLTQLVLKRPWDLNGFLLAYATPGNTYYIGKWSS